MAEYTIPQDLLDALRSKRVIPFVGAGFSSPHGYPGWHAMLEKVAAEIAPDHDYSNIRAECQDDPLQVAEYLYIRAGNSIGPLRYAITTQLHSALPPEHSSAHVELENLQAPRIYTTNFDDLIEKTYRALGLPVEVVALPRDVALSQSTDAQVIKYHGDLRHDSTLVLTESQYYARLDFESPMDLKFRSDLLGRSVLFVGYGFRDINIRVIWFKLMNMMRDVPQQSRPASYIVRLSGTPALDLLYDAVGIRTIILDPGAKARSENERAKLLADFMLDLNPTAMSRTRRAGRSEPPTQFVSPLLLERLAAVLPSDRTSRAVFTGEGLAVLVGLAMRKVPPELSAEAQEALYEASVALWRRGQSIILVGPLLEFAVRLLGEFGPTPGATLAAMYALLNPQLRAQALSMADETWREIWRAELTSSDVRRFANRFKNEVSGHANGEFADNDLAYAADLAKRMVDGSLAVQDGDELREELQGLLDQVAEMYPSITAYEPSRRCPNPAETLDEIATVRAESEDASETGDGIDDGLVPEDDDIPF